MALIVEDGTGLINADSYVSLADFKTNAVLRGYEYDIYEDAAIEAALRNATGWIDTQARYKGQRLRVQQSLEFPRDGLYDWSSYIITGVPIRVKTACVELAYKALSEPLYQDLDRGGMVTSESVGPVSISYSADAPAGKLWHFAKRLLEPYVREKHDFTAALWTEPETAPQFKIGMNDYPGDVSD